MEKVVEPIAGDILGRNYLIESELGRGGFGVVFKARHIDIERVVAIKVLLATYARKDPSAKERFRREATIAASLNYPNSLRVFDYGETSDGVFYLVMEYLKGTELTKLLQREGRLPIPRALHIIRQVLYALSEAHMRGIVHRDIKPDNIMLVELAYDPDYVKVMDFGIAKMVDAGDQITKAGITLGTPRYMPVEQLKGERLTPATDLYAVGLVLYEMLVGAPAFDAPTAVDLALQVMRGPSVRVPADSSVPEVMVQVIEKAVARDCHDRYQTAGEFLDALDIAATALGVVGPDELQLPPVRTTGIGQRPKATGSTLAMPQIDRDRVPEGGDIQDVMKTTTLDSVDVKARAASHGLTRSERASETQSLDVHVVKEALAAQATRDEAVTRDSETMTGASLTTTTFVRGPDGQPMLVNTMPPATVGNAGVPPLLILMHAATIVLLVVLIALSVG